MPSAYNSLLLLLIQRGDLENCLDRDGGRFVGLLLPLPVSGDNDNDHDEADKDDSGTNRDHSKEPGAGVLIVSRVGVHRGVSLSTPATAARALTRETAIVSDVDLGYPSAFACLAPDTAERGSVHTDRGRWRLDYEQCWERTRRGCRGRECRTGRSKSRRGRELHWCHTAPLWVVVGNPACHTIEGTSSPATAVALVVFVEAELVPGTG